MTAVFIELTGKDSKCIVNVNTIFIVNPRGSGVEIEFTDNACGDFAESYDTVCRLIAQATGKQIRISAVESSDDEHSPKVRRP